MKKVIHIIACGVLMISCGCSSIPRRGELVELIDAPPQAEIEEINYNPKFRIANVRICEKSKEKWKTGDIIRSKIYLRSYTRQFLYDGTTWKEYTKIKPKKSEAPKENAQQPALSPKK